MKTSHTDPPDIESKRPGAIARLHGACRHSNPEVPSLPVVKEPPSAIVANNSSSFNNGASLPVIIDEKKLVSNESAPFDDAFAANLAATSSLAEEGQGPVVATSRAKNEKTNDSGNGDSNNGNAGAKTKKRGFVAEVRRTFWLVMTYSWLNVLLVFVPIGIAVANIHGVNGGIVFAMNCIAVIPLAGLLSHATESVAYNMGDSLGALLNVTFGNAVELIIFIALVKNEIRIVQASLLGSILANLLLILGMGFFLGGLRFREQIYNSTVTQMSACLLSLSVISLVLPTAFHASFNDNALADKQSLKISRGTSVILLLVYIIYLLFQLKSHAYMYESTPQHIVDAESIPGPAAAWLESSSSDDTSSSSSDSDSSGHSKDTIDTMRRKVKKVLRAGRKRKSSVTSTDTGDTNPMRCTSGGLANTFSTDEILSEASSSRPRMLPHGSPPENNEEAVEEEREKPLKSSLKKRVHRHRRKGKKHRHEENDAVHTATNERPEFPPVRRDTGEPRRVDFAVPIGTGLSAAVTADEGIVASTSRRPFPILRGISVKNLAPTVFTQNTAQLGAEPQTPVGHVPRVRYGIRRTNSLPDRLSSHQFRPPGAMLPSQISRLSLNAAAPGQGEEANEEILTRTASIILLLITTGLVAVCAEFLVGSIQEVTKTSAIGETFIGLIILPIVGNAAEHVTALTVAMKNKMDLAIGVAVGSSIQIAIFVTPLVVILGWIIGREMTLYFTLFETVSLFVSAFMVNFLVLDGRSNYLEGALLCAVYIIIAIVAFFFPSGNEASAWGE